MRFLQRLGNVPFLSLLDCEPAFDFLAQQTFARFICIAPELFRPCDIQNLIKKNVRQWCGQRGRRLHRLSTATVTRKHAVKNANWTASPVQFSKSRACLFFQVFNSRSGRNNSGVMQMWSAAVRGKTTSREATTASLLYPAGTINRICFSLLKRTFDFDFASLEIKSCDDGDGFIIAPEGWARFCFMCESSNFWFWFRAILIFLLNAFLVFDHN